MAKATIELRGSDIVCSPAYGGTELRFALGDHRDRLLEWAKRYESSVHSGNEELLRELGREMFAFLDASGWASAWARKAGDRILEIQVRGSNADQEAVLLDAPWELLATADGPLAQHSVQLFVVSRRLGDNEEPWTPLQGDIQLMFLAAAPEGATVLDFEAEEAAILSATQSGRTHLVVEETGSIEFLKERMTSAEGPFEALHISCHGDLDPSSGPVLMLESLEGDPRLVSPGEIVTACGPQPPALIFLSACRTAALGAKADASEPRQPQRLFASPDVTMPFARQISAQIANVVGWDGSVYDRDATLFAAEFYAQLALGFNVPRAAAMARRRLLDERAQNPERGQHWHLARVFLGPGGSGPLCDPKKPVRRHFADAAPRAFLDRTRKRVPVASREAFVGRRRTLQSILREYRRNQAVLIFGMGAVGKSSSAARIANRVALRPCVIFGRYDALAIFDELLAMIPQIDRADQKNLWRERVSTNDWELASVIEAWLCGPLDADPILLIIDDLEQILEVPAPGDVLTAVNKEYAPALGAVLMAFARAATRSKLLLTSRYDFTLPDGLGGDLASELIRKPLNAMPPSERRKQLRAAARIAGWEELGEDPEAEALLQRALNAAAGNPGLQTVLTRPILAREYEVAARALKQIETFRDTGVPPAEIQALIDTGSAKDLENALLAFFSRISLQTYRDALTEDELLQLGAATLFSEGVPIPRPAMAAAARELGCKSPEPSIDRLLALGLLEDWSTPDVETPSYSANALARPLVPPLTEEERSRLAHAALSELEKTWRHETEGFLVNDNAVEAAKLALLAPDHLPRLEEAVMAAVLWLHVVKGQSKAAFHFVAAAHSIIPMDYEVGPEFIQVCYPCTNDLGEIEIREALLDRPMRQSEDERLNMLAAAHLNRKVAEQLIGNEKYDEAEKLLEKSLQTFEAFDDHDMILATRCNKVDILKGRDKFEEAEEILDDILGLIPGSDWRWTQIVGKLADIKTKQRKFKEAIEIRNRQLPILRREMKWRDLSVCLTWMAIDLIGIGTKDSLELALKHVQEAYIIAAENEYPDGVLSAGRLLISMLVAMGYKNEARALLGPVTAAWEKLQRPHGPNALEDLRAALEDKDESSAT